MPAHHLALTWPNGREETVRAGDDETVLEAAESADVSLPFGCHSGACASCVGRFVEGDVDYDRPPRGLRARHVEAGYVLSCVARPRTNCRVVVGNEARTDLVSNPWD